MITKVLNSGQHLFSEKFASVRDAAFQRRSGSSDRAAVLPFGLRPRNERIFTNESLAVERHRFKFAFLHEDVKTLSGDPQKIRCEAWRNERAVMLSSRTSFLENVPQVRELRAFALGEFLNERKLGCCYVVHALRLAEALPVVNGSVRGSFGG